jgi:hypothetical protein
MMKWLSVLLLCAASCGNLMDAPACLRECSDKHTKCWTSLVLLNAPVAQSSVLNAGLLLTCESDKVSCEERCSQPLGE